MSTLGSLMLALSDPGIQPYNAQELTANRIQSGNTQNQTQLLELAALKRQQAAEAELMRAAQTDPRVQALLFGGSTLGSLGQAGGPPGGAPMRQQAFAPGQPPGAPQLVPGGQDLSQFATQGAPGAQNPRGFAPEGSTPQQSILASLGPAGQPQGPMQAQRNPVLEMASTNPRAAMMLQQQLEGRQDMVLKRQAQQLKMGTAVLGYVGQQAQGVTDQASLDAMRSDLQSQSLGKYAAQLPQLYSKGAMEPFIAKALDVKDRLQLQIQELEASTKAGTLGLAQQRAAQTIPNYTGDAQLDAIIYTKMKDQPPGTMPSREIVEGAYKQREEDKLRVSRDQGAAQESLKPLGETATLRFNTLTQAEDTVKKLTTEFTPEERRKFTGMGGLSFNAEQLKQLTADATGGKADPKFARFAALVALAKAEAFSTAGKALTKTEEGVVYGYIPTGKEYSAEEFEQKLSLAQERIPSMLDRELKLATTPRSELTGMRARGELGASTSPPARTGRAGPLKPVSQMSAEETRAEIAAIKARGGK